MEGSSAGGSEPPSASAAARRRHRRRRGALSCHYHRMRLVFVLFQRTGLRPRCRAVATARPPGSRPLRRTARGPRPRPIQEDTASAQDAQGWRGRRHQAGAGGLVGARHVAAQSGGGGGGGAEGRARAGQAALPASRHGALGMLPSLPMKIAPTTRSE
jgi:hypothetical protein